MGVGCASSEGGEGGGGECEQESVKDKVFLQVRSGRALLVWNEGMLGVMEEGNG